MRSFSQHPHFTREKPEAQKGARITQSVIAEQAGGAGTLAPDSKPQCFLPFRPLC